MRSSAASPARDTPSSSVRLQVESDRALVEAARCARASRRARRAARARPRSARAPRPARCGSSGPTTKSFTRRLRAGGCRCSENARKAKPAHHAARRPRARAAGAATRAPTGSRYTRPGREQEERVARPGIEPLAHAPGEAGRDAEREQREAEREGQVLARDRGSRARAAPSAQAARRFSARSFAR